MGRERALPTSTEKDRFRAASQCPIVAHRGNGILVLPALNYARTYLTSFVDKRGQFPSARAM